MAKILLVDDIEGIAVAIKRTLESGGHAIDVCGNGQEAMDCLDKNSYDLVITDILMPERDGLELAKYIRKDLLPEERRKTPIIAITGGGALVTLETTTEAAKLHADVVLLKPFDSAQIKKAIEPYI